jgi:hypothetical protein
VTRRVYARPCLTVKGFAGHARAMHDLNPCLPDIPTTCVSSGDLVMSFAGAVVFAGFLCMLAVYLLGPKDPPGGAA